MEWIKNQYKKFKGLAIKFKELTKRRKIMCAVVVVVLLCLIGVVMYFLPQIISLAGVILFLRLMYWKPTSKLKPQEKYAYTADSLYVTTSKCAEIICAYSPTSVESLKTSNGIEVAARNVEYFTYRLTKRSNVQLTASELDRAKRILQGELEANYRAKQLPPIVCGLAQLPIVIFKMGDDGDYLILYTLWNDNANVQKYLDSYNAAKNQVSTNITPIQPGRPDINAMPLFFDKALYDKGHKEFVQLPLNVVHWLLTAPSGGGKSVACIVWLYQLVNSLMPTVGLSIWILDFKRSEDYNFLLSKAHYFSHDEVLTGLRRFYNEVFEPRLNNTDKRRTFQILVIEELSRFLNSLNKAENSEAVKLIARMTQLSRSLSIRILCIVQRPDMEYFGKFRENFSVKVALASQSPEAKRMMFPDFLEQMSETHAQGEGYMQIDNKLYTVRVPRIKQAEFAKLHEVISQAVD